VWVGELRFYDLLFWIKSQNLGEDRDVYRHRKPRPVWTYTSVCHQLLRTHRGWFPSVRKEEIADARESAQWLRDFENVAALTRCVPIVSPGVDWCVPASRHKVFEHLRR
jgi:hypothetical protein